MARNGQVKTTREDYEAAKKLRDRWLTKIKRALAVIEHWEKIESQNRQRLGENVMVSITQDNGGALTIQSESPAAATA